MALEWWEYLVPILFIPLMYFLSYLAVIVLSKLERIARHTATKLDDRIIEYSKRPLKLIFVFLGVFLAVYYTLAKLFPSLGAQVIYETYTMEAGEKVVHGVTLMDASNTVFMILGVLLVAYAVARLANAFFDWYLFDMLQGLSLIHI